ncbi:MAG: prepilin peptidase [Firmicutes bacterium]|nr:prepilin peptidase [Bacillota bacterium]
MDTIFFIWTVFWLVRIAVEDVRSLTIPDRYTIAILAAAPFLSSTPLGARLFAAVIPAVLIPLMGMGDIKLYSALGFCLGFRPLLRIACGSMLTGGICAGILLLLKKVKKKDRIPFGPFIACSAVLALAADYFASTSAMWAISLSMLAV